MKKKALGVATFLIILILLLGLCNYIVTPNKSKLATFHQLPNNSVDVLAIGTSHLFCAFNTEKLWADYGIASYLLANNAQTPAAAYLYALDAVKTQSPEVMVIDTFMLLQLEDFQDFSVNDTFAYKSFYGVPSSIEKHKTIRELLDIPSRAAFYFPLYQNHGRWTHLQKADFIQFGNPRDTGFQGALPASHDIQAQKPALVSSNTPLSKKNFAYFESLLALCEENTIRPIAVLTPCDYRPGITADDWQEKNNFLKQYLKERNIPYYDYNDLSDDIDFDYSEDLADFDHVTTSGMLKFTDHFGHRLAVDFDVPNRKGSDSHQFWENLLKPEGQ